MSDATRPDPPNGDANVLAAEYALGLLDAAGRATAERRMALDPAFAREVANWDRRLAPLAEQVTPVSPPAALWDEIERRIAAVPVHRAAPSRAALPETRGRWWDSLAFWRTLSAGALTAAAASIALLVLTPRPAPMPAPMVATLMQENGPPAFVATIDPARHAVTIVPAAHHAPDPRAPELWLVVPGAKPVSLGLLAMDRAMTMPMPDMPVSAATPGAALAITLEPPGGSPTGGPTGPMLAQGPLSFL